MRHFLALSVLLLLAWGAPLTTCKGDPLTDLDHYTVPVFTASILAWETCVMPDETAYDCPVYVRARLRLDVGISGDDCAPGWPFPCINLSAFEPRVGEVLGYEHPEAIDPAGNSSILCEDPDV